MQRKAVDSGADKICVIAGAGSGKTHILIERLTRLVQSGVNPESILVLTFTNAAAGEMTTRYSNKNKGTTPKFGTFHAFCYSLIIKDINVRMSLQYSSVPNVATPDDIKNLRSKVRIICGTKISDAKLDDPSKLRANERFEYDIFWKQYDKSLRQSNLITFDIMCDEVCDLFKQNNPIILKYKEQYKYVMVDEFQDTGSSLWEFVQSFEESKLFVVGDYRQALYSFRGADSSIIKGLAKNPEWETIVLSQNYRSTQPIVDYANKIHHFKASDLNIDMKSDTPGEPIVFKPAFNSRNIDDVLAISSDKTDDNTVAILCRTNAEVAEMKAVLTSNNIPYITKNANKAIIEYLLCSIDSEYCVKYLSSELSQEEYMRYLKTTAVEDITEEQFYHMFGKNCVYASTKIIEIRSIIAKESMPSLLFNKLTKYLRLNLDANIGLDCKSVEDVIYKIADALDVQCDKGIYVGTIHSSKGLEYDVVHVIGVNGKSFPTMKNEDQQNCYYVACTRAKSKLVIWDEDL